MSSAYSVQRNLIRALDGLDLFIALGTALCTVLAWCKSLMSIQLRVQATWGKPAQLIDVPEGELTIPITNGLKGIILQKEQSRYWKPGDHIHLNPDDCEEIAASLMLFCRQVRETLDHLFSASNLASK